MKRLLSFLLIGLALAGLVLPSQAQFMNYTPLEAINVCWQPRVYDVHDTSALPPIARLLAAAGPRAAVRACTDARREGLHMYLRIAALPRNGICRAREVEFFQGNASDTADIMPVAGQPMLLRGWRTDPPSEWKQLGYRARSSDLALVSDGSCPPVHDARYILTPDVSDEDIKGFDRFWRAATASPEAFERALRDVPFEIGAHMAWRRMGQAGLVQEFRSRVFDGRIAPRTMNCSAQTCSVSVGWMDRWIEFRRTPDGLTPVRQGGYLMA